MAISSNATRKQLGLYEPTTVEIHYGIVDQPKVDFGCSSWRDQLLEQAGIKLHRFEKQHSKVT